LLQDGEQSGVERRRGWGRRADGCWGWRVLRAEGSGEEEEDEEDAERVGHGEFIGLR